MILRRHPSLSWPAGSPQHLMHHLIQQRVVVRD